AAYNWGEGNVMRAIKRNQAEGLGTGYEDLRMPAETRDYVPKLQAVKNIVRAPGQFGIGLPPVGNHPFFDSVTVDRDLDVSLIAQLAEVSEKDFRQLNPSHNKPVVMAAGTPTILLPWDNALRFEERLRQHTGPTASWTAWRVPSHMTAAHAAQQHGLSETELREINKIPPRMLLRAGSTVLVPRQGTLDRDVPEHIADNGQIQFVPERAAQRSQRVKVRAGDTQAKFAKRHRVSVAELRRWNRLQAHTPLRAGQTLLVVRAEAQAVAHGDADRGSRKAATVTKNKPKGNKTAKAAATQKTQKVKTAQKPPAQSPPKTAKSQTGKKTTVASSKTPVTAR
ncbi:LysM peptidoglycan-binding domain-containing protein, partial [Aquabacterium sp. A08]|uniref:LysM peptidoglycan-binding domain-containing protein n=1 Tax=Aquabacterium sp. A08 TaxID=2718532 RepID=UPI001421E429